MKLILQFRIGDSPLSLEEAWDWERVNARLLQAVAVPEKAAPQDLDLLSLTAARFNGREELSFAGQKKSLYESPQNGASLLDNQWLEYFAAVPQDKLEELTKAWCQEIQKMFLEVELAADEELKGFVKQLADLCREALAGGKPLVYLWSLR